MATYLFAWNPAEARPPSFDDEICEIARGGSVKIGWRCAKNLPKGSRVFLIRLGKEPRGIIGSGWTENEPAKGRIKLKIDRFSEMPIIPFARLQKRPFETVHWSIQGSGVQLPDDTASRLETAWAAAAPAPDQSSSKLFETAIYVNAGVARLRKASHGASPSDAIVEQRVWTKGEQLFLEAQRQGRELPLIFAQYPQLTFWAVARDITICGDSTTYRFANLRVVTGRRRQDLKVSSTGKCLPDSFIRSYAIVETPQFLAAAANGRRISENDATETLGELDKVHQASYRTEQAFLRQYVLGDVSAALCQICGHEVPIDLLVAAHIKPRAKCSDREKRDYKNNVMAMCKFGCDDLFERGYIVVRKGIIQAGTRPMTSAVRDYVEVLVGSECVGWNARREKYFEWRAQRQVDSME